MIIGVGPDMDVGWVHPWVGLGWVWVVFFEIYVGLVGSGENNFI